MQYYSSMPLLLAIALLPVIVAADVPEPYLLPLRREKLSKVQNGRTISVRSAYYGTVSLGAPASQEFSVVFDTGSGHVVVPSTGCRSASCLEHQRYSLTSSQSAVAVQSDGLPVRDDELADEVTIGFGTGTLTGQFARESVCMGSSVQGNHSEAVANETGGTRRPCSTVNIVMAVEMSDQPFRSFRFDGIFGLGLGGLTLGPEFSFFHQLTAGDSRSAPPPPSRFGIFLSATEDGSGSEIAIGGQNSARFAAPLTWESVALPELGYWQVQIQAIRIGSEELPLCRTGACRAVLDTGTSHLGTPRQHLPGLMQQLTVPAPEGSDDCRTSLGPIVSIDLQNITLTLRPEDYMQQEPLKRRGRLAGSSRSVCRPALMPVNFQAPLGPNLFILGEPLLRRYYTVYDWGEQRVGFSLAKADTDKSSRAKAHDPPDEEESVVLLLQVTLTLTPQPVVPELSTGSALLLP